MTKILCPSEINFLKDKQQGVFIKPNEDVLMELSSKFQEKNQVPKIQVSEKNGSWYALNNTSLYLVKELQKQGKCDSIQVEIVPLTKVPESLQNCMIKDDISEDDEQTPELKDTHCERRTQRKLQIEENFGIESEYSNETKNCANYYDECDSSSSSGSDYEQEYEDSDNDEPLICNVCDRNFQTGRQLAKHQLHSGHYLCSICDALFPNLMDLQMHKKSLAHWTDDENECSDDCEEDNLQPYEEVERLL